MIARGAYGAVLARQGNGLFSDNILALDNPSPEAAHVVWRQSGGPAPPLITGRREVGTGWHHLAVTYDGRGGATAAATAMRTTTTGAAGIATTDGV